MKKFEYLKYNKNDKLYNKEMKRYILFLSPDCFAMYFANKKSLTIIKTNNPKNGPLDL